MKNESQRKKYPESNKKRRFNLLNPEGLEGEIKLQESASQQEMHARGTKINEEKSQVNMGKCQKDDKNSESRCDLCFTS